GTRTWETVPGLKRQLLNVWMVSLSSTGLPVLWNILASVTVPVAVSTFTTHTPLPVRLRRFASYVYPGKGAVIAMDCATESDIGTGAGMLTGSGCTAGRGRFFSRGFFSAGTAATPDSSAEGACSTGVTDF